VREAEGRAWEVVKRAYEERTPRPRRASSHRLVIGIVVVALGVAAGAAASPPGQAVFEKVREAVGVQHAQPALFALPSRGRLLVVSAKHGGVWLIQPNGLKRRIGSYEDAQWSPHGLFIIATTKNALAAIDADGNTRWSLARRSPSSPRWEGTRTDTRIAYVTPGGLRVVAGDGTGDRLFDPRAQATPPAWDPALLHTVAYVAGGAVVLRDTDTGSLVWRAPIRVLPTELEWSNDGQLLALRSEKRIIVLGANGRTRRVISTLAWDFSGMAFKPRTHRLAVTMRLAGRSEVRLADIDHPGTTRLLFAGPGVFGDIAWSPDDRWLLVSWPTADQWVFLHGARVQAVANIREQFPRKDHLGPTLQLDQRWCC
jgi:putative pyrroloquinoline-quinone binding quinoprotein